MKRVLWIWLVIILSGCALVPEYETPISEHHEELKEEQATPPED